MSDMASTIMDAAEQRMRKGGFSGFSFREIAADVGVKSSSIHYHFPTKENLAVAVVDRYTNMASQHFDEEVAKDGDPVKAFVKVLRGTLTTSTKRMCPCTILAAGARDLPEDVVASVKRFFNMSLEKLEHYGLGKNEAAALMSRLIGAQVLANNFGDVAIYDRAVADLVESSGAKRARKTVSSRRH